jgi:hypothetical protein
MTRLNSPDELFLEIGGIPFVDEGFKPANLVTLVAILRRNIDGGSNALRAYLDPELSVALYRQTGAEQIHSPPSGDLSASDIEAIDSAILGITQMRPAWRDLFRIPLKFKRLLTEQVSLTNFLIPQYVYLGRRATDDAFLLSETLVHELSHVWNGFILEIFDWQVDACPKDYVLPSGTTGKDIRGVLFAGLFAAAALNYYMARGDQLPQERARARVKYLKKYLDECLDTVRCSPFVSRTGDLLAERLLMYSGTVPPTLLI